MNQKNLLEVDWSKIPAPTDDGAAAHLVGMTIPPVSLVATDDTSVTLSALPGRTVVFAYPRTGEPGKISLVDDWDMIPGARGCTPQTCAFRDLFAELKAAGAAHVFGLSTQSNAYQTEMASRLHLPFPVLSDEKLKLTQALDLPTMQVAGLTMIKRLALIIDDARITHVFYPVFPPDRNAGDVLAWLKENPVAICRVGKAKRAHHCRSRVKWWARRKCAYDRDPTIRQIRLHLREHAAKHLRRQHPRVGVVARAMIAVVQLQRAGLMHRAVRKRRRGGAKAQHLQHRIMRDPAERHDRAQFRHRLRSSRSEIAGRC